jgi:hypothetical protein
MSTSTIGPDDSVKPAPSPLSDTAEAKITSVPKRGPPAGKAPSPKAREKTHDTQHVADPILEAQTDAQATSPPASPLAGRVRPLSGHAVSSTTVGTGGEAQLIKDALKSVLSGTSPQKLSQEELDELATPPLSPALAKKEQPSGTTEAPVDKETATTPLLLPKVKTRPTTAAPQAPGAPKQPISRLEGKGPPSSLAPAPPGAPKKAVQVEQEDPLKQTARPPTPEQTAGSGDEGTGA